MRLIAKTYLGQMSLSIKYALPEKASPKFGEVATKATEGLYYRTSRK